MHTATAISNQALVVDEDTEESATTDADDAEKDVEISEDAALWGATDAPVSL